MRAYIISKVMRPLLVPSALRRHPRLAEVMWAISPYVASQEVTNYLPTLDSVLNLSGTSRVGTCDSSQIWRPPRWQGYVDHVPTPFGPQDVNSFVGAFGSISTLDTPPINMDHVSTFDSFPSSGAVEGNRGYVANVSTNVKT